MIKPIIASPVTRKFVTTAMLATSVLATNATIIHNDKNKTPQTFQTELIGADAAKTIKTNAMKLETFGFEHNKKLDDIYIKNCLPEISKKNKKDNLDAMYRVYGTFGATIEIQREIDSHFMEKAINSYLDHYSLTDQNRRAAQEIISHFYGWQDNVLFTDLLKDELKMYEEQDFPSAEKAISYVDKHINNKEFFTDVDKKIYDEHSRNFQSKQINKDGLQALSDLLAYKVHLLNILAFDNYFSKNHSVPEKQLFVVYFITEFVNGEASIKPNSSK